MPTNYKTYFFCFSSMPFYETAFLNSNLLHHEMTFQSVHLLTFGPRSAKANLAAAEEFFSPVAYMIKKIVSERPFYR